MTCSSDGLCSVRASGILESSGLGEISYLPSSLCYSGGSRITVGDPRSGVGCVAATGSGFILYSGENIRSRFQNQFKEDMADNFVCVRRLKRRFRSV